MSPFSLVAQVQAIAMYRMDSLADKPIVPREKRADASRYARADVLRQGALALLADTDSAVIEDFARKYHGTTEAQWPWILKTLADRGLVTRTPRIKGCKKSRFAITDAGRKALAALNTVTTGAH